MVDFIFKDISSFEEDFFESGRPISYIGTGSMGGKAQGLAFINETLSSGVDHSDFQGVEICIPKMVVILSDVFDAFMQQNNLYEIALSDASDERIALAFQQADLPFKIPGILRTFIARINSPLAIRSSGLFEDSIGEPFAGVYGTKMIPNNQVEIDTRFRKLIKAIKFVYASTFYTAAKDYLKATNHDPANEKMSVIIQEVVGTRHNNRFYPEISGTARSYNFYSTGHAKPEDGVVNLALGLGKTIVDGGFTWFFSPSFPKSGPVFNSVEDMLEFTQTEFWAVNMGRPPEYNPISETEYMIRNDLLCAEEDGTLKQIASTYDISGDRVWMGMSEKGPRIINFAPLLHDESFQMNKLIKRILFVCEKALKAPVEIEFAITLSDNVKRFGFLQVRPIVLSLEENSFSTESIKEDDIFISSDNVMGNGVLNSIRDIVYFDIQKFNSQTSFQIAGEIESLNRKLVASNQPYLLIGCGRWGTSDPVAGIPVKWQQISGAKVIVEAPIEKAYVEMSQGSHFFHNITSLQIIYFSIPPGSKQKFDVDWLRDQELIEEKKFVRHVRCDRELLVKADGRSGKGIILKYLVQ